MTLCLGTPNLASMSKEHSSLIDDLGGTSAVAAVFGIAPASVSDWRTKGIPKARRQTLALLYPDKVPADWKPGKQCEAAA